MFFNRRTPRAAAFVVAAATAATVGSGFTALSANAAGDTTPPVLVSVQAPEPASVDVSTEPSSIGQLIHVTDAGGSGVSYVEAVADCVANCPAPQFEGDTPPQLFGYSNFSTGDPNDRTIGLTFDVTSYDAAATYQINKITVHDRDGNTSTYSQTPGSGEQDLTTLASAAQRQIVVTRNNLDGTPPHLVGTPQFSVSSGPDISLANADVSLTFEIADANPGVDPQSLNVFLDSTDKPWLDFWNPNDFWIQRISGDNHDGVYRATFTADPSKVATWEINRIEANDLQGTRMSIVNGDAATTSIWSSWPTVAPTMTNDTTGPVFVNTVDDHPTLSPSTANVSVHADHVVLTQHITDKTGGIGANGFPISDTGLDHGQAVFSDTNGHSISGSISPMDVTSGHAWDGTFMTSIQVPYRQVSGAYSLTHLELADRAGHTDVWDTNPSWVGNGTLMGTPPALGFQVTTAADTAGPQLNGIQLSQPQVNIDGDTNRGPVAYLQITDDSSGFTNGQISYTTPSATTKTVNFDLSNLQQPGNEQSGTYGVRLPSNVGGVGTYTVIGVKLWDQLNADPTVLSQSDVESKHSNAPVSFVAVDDAGDNARPVVDSVTVSPASVDVSGSGKDVTVTVQAHDPQGGAASPTGLGGIDLTFSSPGGTFTTFAGDSWSYCSQFDYYNCGASLTGGNDDSGTYTFTTNISRWAANGPWTLTEVTAWDGANNWSDYSDDAEFRTDPLSAIGGTHTITVTSPGDVTPPSVAKLTLAPTPIQATDGASVSASGVLEITDDLSGVQSDFFGDSNTLEFTSQSGKQHAFATLQSPQGLGTNVTDLTIPFTVDFPKYAETGTWTPSLDLTDNAYNEATLSAANLTALNNPNVLTGFTVNGKPDVTNPAIASFALNTHSVDVSTGAKWVVGEIHATDAESGVSQTFKVHLTDPNGQDYDYNYARRFGGNGADGYYLVGVFLPPNATNGVWHVAPLGVSDDAGNVNNGTGTGDDITVTGGINDSVGPVLTSLSLPPTVNITGGNPGTETATVSVNDPGSGFASGSLFFSGPDGWQSTSRSFSTSDPHTGDTYTVDVPVPGDAASGTWTLQSVTLRDASGNPSYYSLGNYPGGVDTTFTVNNPSAGTATGVVSGTISGPSGVLSGASVTVCKSTGWPCQFKTSAGDGTYSATSLPDGTYTVYVYPPFGSSLNSGQKSGTVTGGSTATVDVTLTAPDALTPSDHVSVNGTSTGVPTVFWGNPINLAADGCTGGSAAYTIKDSNGTTIPNGSGTMSESAGHYTATVPAPYPSHGTMDVTIVITCPNPSDNTSPEFTLYIDPSGFVKDTNGNALPGATVTLSRSDTVGGTYTAVPNGSAIMSPSNRTNPDTTDSSGHYGWDVTTGFYKVTAAKTDCYAPNSYSNATNTVTAAVTSAAQQIPPAVTNLNLILDCTNIKPVAAFSQPTTASVNSPVNFDGTSSKDANGSVASYSWNFGDGTTGTGATPSHAYAVGGSYTPTLTVTDDQGLTSLVKTGSAIVVGGTPGTVGNLSATSGVHSVDLSWTAPSSNGSPITGYTVDVTPGGQHLTPTGTSVSVTGLTANTSYTFTVKAVNALGSSAPATTSAVAGATPNKPTVSITSKPAALTNATSGNVGFTTAVDPSVTLSSVTCSVDGAAATACTSPTSLTGLAGGSHTVVVTATDSDGNQGSSSAQWVVDTTAPTAGTVQPASTTTLGKSFGVSWGGADSNGVASYDVQYTKAAWNGKFGAPTVWKSATTATSGSFTGVPGYEYCFSVRAHDQAGNVSGYSSAKCTAIPLDDRSLVASAGWKKLTGKTFYLGTAVQTAAKGKTLTSKGAGAGRAVLYVDKGKGFGSIAVLYNGKIVKTVSLAATKAVTKFAVALPKISKTTTVVIKTTTAKTVQIDGLLLARI